jgi:hypothetical protein
MVRLDRSYMSSEQTAEDIMNRCRKVYGSSTDGSFEACLHFEGYYKLKREENLLTVTMKEFEENKNENKRNGDLQKVRDI